jgi:hypothetical protein
MRFEALAWTLLEVLAPTLAREVQDRLGSIAPELRELAGWTHDLLIPYLALILGSVSARDAGLANFEPFARWPAALACLLGFAAAYLIRRKFATNARPHTTPLEALRLEPRLALYRAASALWLPGMTFTVAVGGLLALVEWGLSNQIWRRETHTDRIWSRFLRIVFSSLIFWATHNFWLTALTQTAIVTLLENASTADRSLKTEDSAGRGKESDSPARPNNTEEIG